MRIVSSPALVAVLAVAHAQTMVGPGMKTIGTATKEGVYKAGTELTLFDHTVTAEERAGGAPNTVPGVITHQWFTGSVMNENTRIRVYVDGEAAPSLDFMLLQAHGVGFSKDMEKPHTPWGTDVMGHLSDNGGLYNNFRIPFQKSVRITMYRDGGDGIFWYIVRGVTNYPLVVGDLQLPASARLRLFVNSGVTLAPLQFLPLANVSGTAGLLYQVAISANSTDFNYLEACVRAYVDGAQQPLFLSSGTEDYFSSAFYYDRGLFHTTNAGLTQQQLPGLTSAYRIHEKDPVLFTTSLALLWRCGEVDGGCPKAWPPAAAATVEAPAGGGQAEHRKRPLLAATTVTTYTWLYTYSF